MTTQASEQFRRLIEILDRLRGDNGCPWDRAQTSKTLVPYLLEETYEVIEAIEAEDAEMLREELGDLSLHVLFQAHIANEKGLFDISDSLRHICDKLVRRHPHVFSDESVSNVQEIHQNWEAIKQKEKKRKNFLDGVPKTLPALTRARRVQEKAANIGFDWPDIKPVWDKLDEELSELREAWSTQNADQIEEELGDLLFTIVNLGRFLNISSEEALRQATAKFERRFAVIESELEAQEKSLDDASLEDMDRIWDRVKAEERL